MAALEMVSEVEPRGHRAMQPAAVEPLRAVPELPPRAGEMVAAAAPAPDIAARATMSVGLQQTVGNARMGEMVAPLAPAAAPPTEEPRDRGTEGPEGPEGPKPKGAPEARTTPAEKPGEEAKPAAKAPAEEKKKAEGGGKKGEGEGKEKAAPPSPRQAIAPAVHAVNDRAKKASKHAEAGPLVDSTQAAAINPVTEQTRDAAQATVATLDDAKAEKVQRAQFKAALEEAIEKATPQPTTEAQADAVMKTGAKDASAALSGSLATQRDAAAGSLKGANAAEVQPSDVKAPAKADMKSEAVGAPPAPVSAAPVVPAPLPAERLDYSSDRGETDNAMADAGVTTEQLGKGNEPQFNKTLSERSNAEEHEAKAEAAYRKTETNVQAQTQKAAQGAIAKDLGGMHDAREMNVGKATGQQNATKTKNAQERQRITDTIAGIKDATRIEVGQILDSMEKEAAEVFEAGLKRAEQAYEDTFEEEKGGVGTWLTTWGSDWEKLIERSLKRARLEYLRIVGVAIDEVADLVDAKLTAAKNRVADGRKQVEDFVKGLNDNVREFGDEALKEVSADFDAMGSEIDQRRDNLVDKLAQQYKASYERMSAKEEELREANKSLWQRVYDATVGLIKKILAFKDMLLNVLAKAAEVVMDIISDPIGFLGNLVTGVMRGLENFMSNIATHLQRELMEWLFGELAGSGLQLPESFDLAGIISIILQILGLTYANFRARAVAIVGEPLVAALEEAAEVFKIVMTEGISGLWRFIKEKVEDLKSMVMDAIFDFIKERVIIAGVTWIIGLLNPASAFFKACKAIYDIVMFFINRGSQILALVNAIIDSISAIAKGNLDTAAKWVENALAKAIPVAIGFLAALLGLGDISGTIRKTIDKAREPVNKAIDWVIRGAVKGVKAVGKAIGGLFGKKEPEPEKGKGKEPAAATGEAGHVAIAKEVGAKLIAMPLPEGPIETARQAVQSEGNKLAEASAKVLEPGVSLRVTVIDPPAEKKNHEIDFKVVISPNDTELVFVDPVGDHLPPEAGLHKDLIAKDGRTNSDGSKQESHHAPPVELANSMGNALNEAGADLQEDDPEAAAVLTGAGAELSAKVAGHGGQLSAILMHEKTHRVRGAGTPRVHGSEIRAELGRYLTGHRAADVATTAKGEPVVKGGGEHYKKQISKVAQTVAGHSDLTEALRVHGTEIVNRVYDAEEARSIGAVEVALSKSEIDGPADARRSAIAVLREKAKDSWHYMIALVKFK